MRFDEHFIRQVLCRVSIYGTFPLECNFTIDSRMIQMGDFFVALSGTFNDGHSFIVEAMKKGASGALIAEHMKEECLQNLEKKSIKNCSLIVVPDPKKALIDLAIAWRKQFSYPVIGVTGSVGKTTTKETIASVLRTADVPFVFSQGNYNTQVGAALSVLRMRSKHKAAVFELGVNRRGEMAALAQIIKPTIGIITSIGHSHMEGLGSLQDIAVEKRDIFKYFTEKNIGIVNGDQPLLSNVSYPHPVIKFGFKTTNQVQARKVRVVDGRTRCVLKLYKQKYDVVLSKPHLGVVINALVASCVGHILQLPHEKILEGIQKPIVVKGRFEQLALKAGNGVMINDCYNASPESMKAALIALQQIETSASKIAVLGDMLELGVNSPFWHRQVGRFFRKVPSLKKVILVGDLVQWVEKTLPLGTQIERVGSWAEAEEKLTAMMDSHDHLVLVKGSHGVGLQNLVKRYTV